MARIGAFAYPAITVTDAIAVAERVAKDFRGEIGKSALAKALSMAENGGGFIHKVAAVRDYGLIEGRGKLKITTLAERIVFPHSSAEEDSAKADAFLQVELFRKLLDRTGGRVPDEESFTIFLQDVTGANRVDIAKQAPTIRRLYADGTQYVRAGAQVTDESPRADDLGAADATLRSSHTGGGTIELLAGDIELRLPKTRDSVDIIIGVLDMMKKQLDGAGEAKTSD